MTFSDTFGLRQRQTSNSFHDSRLYDVWQKEKNTSHLTLGFKGLEFIKIDVLGRFGNNRVLFTHPPYRSASPFEFPETSLFQKALDCALADLNFFLFQSFLYVDGREVLLCVVNNHFTNISAHSPFFGAFVSFWKKIQFSSSEIMNQSIKGFDGAAETLAISLAVEP